MKNELKTLRAHHQRVDTKLKAYTAQKEKAQIALTKPKRNMAKASESDEKVWIEA